MNTRELQPKWEVLEKLPRQGDYDLIRISSVCHPDLSLAISPDEERCLILALPADFHFDFHPLVRQKLSLTKYDEKNYVTVTLYNNDYVDLFDDLIISIHNTIMNVRDAEEYSDVFAQTFHKWVKFFDLDDTARLPDSIIIGMFGELIVMKKLLNEAKGACVNTILRGWKGPYDKGQDFEFDSVNIEVKTRSPSPTSVKIANEGQLDQLEGKELELAVVVVEQDPSKGTTLNHLIRQLVDVIEQLLGDTSILYSAISQKGLGPKNLSDYDDISLVPKELTRYDCLSMSFPRIVRSELGEAIFGVRYSLDTSKLNEHIIEQVKL
jgi:hypothetical protein